MKHTITSFLANTRRALLLLALLACSTAASAAAWKNAAEVSYIADGSPFSEAEVKEAIDYALAAWTSSIAQELNYSADATAPGYHQGKIVIRWVDKVDATEGDDNLQSLATTKRWSTRDTGMIAGAEIVLSRESFEQKGAGNCLIHTVMHEMGHALGLNHVDDKKSVMYPLLLKCNKKLTKADIKAAPYNSKI